MLAAVYARKSTEQTGVADEQKSVSRQVEHARQYAIRKGWNVADEYIYVDDGISGAEFANRPGFLRLMNALKPRPPFQVLIMSEVSRLGREQIETACALKQLINSGRALLQLLGGQRTADGERDRQVPALRGEASQRRSNARSHASGSPIRCSGRRGRAL